MDLRLHKTPNNGFHHLAAGLLVMLSALAYYLLFRHQLPWPGYLLNFNHGPLAHLGDLSGGSYPSFAFTLGMGLICLSIFPKDKALAAIAITGVWIVGVLHESLLGTFSLLDIAAGTVGAIYPFLLLNASKQLNTRHKFDFSDRIKLKAIMLISITLATGTSAYEPIDSSYCIEYDVNDICIERSSLKQPIYLSYANLRSAVKVSEPRELTSVSRIYLYKDMLFINDKNQGIHIVDNSNPANPNRIAFIEIPGNTEVSIRDDNLYVDSYIDLVTLDISDIQNITEIARQEGMFPYNARQNIPNNIRLPYGIDKERGVVVGYR